MTADNSAGKNQPSTPARHPFGPRQIGAVLPAITRPAFRKQGPAAAQLMADWPAIVGPSLAGTTTPRRFVAGTLTLGCTGPVALELQHLAGQLIERINAHLGKGVVHRLRFVQEAALPRAIDAKTATRRLEPIVVDGVADGPLRDALAALGAMVQADRA